MDPLLLFIGAMFLVVASNNKPDIKPPEPTPTSITQTAKVEVNIKNTAFGEEISIKVK